MVRLYARIRGQALFPKTRYLIGLPADLGGNSAELQPMPFPDVLVLFEEPDGSVFLYRMTRSGQFGGDTWHQSVDDAQAQAEFEYGRLMDEWQPIPVEAEDPIDFAVAAVNDEQ